MSTQPSSVVHFTLNGERRALPAGSNLSALIQDLGLQLDRVAIEVDRQIVKPARWDETEVRQGAEIEVVHFVGGG